VSQWGVVRDDERGIHVAPVLSDGCLDVRHQLTEFCACGPREEFITETVSIWIHRDPERGGYNG
jgi:hypothetical protein